MISNSPLEIIANFLNDAAKIVFASLVVGFFVSSEMSCYIFLGGITTTFGFLISAVLTTKLLDSLHN